MSENLLPTATVTPINARANVIPAEEPEVTAEPLAGEGPAAAALAVAREPPARAAAPVSTSVAGLRGRLEQRLHQLTARTLPLAWYRITRVGPAGLLGGAATLMAMVIAAIAFIGARSTMQSLTAQIAHAQAHPTPAAVSDAGVGKVVAELPRRQDMPAVIGLVLAQAKEASVVLDNGHYTYSTPKGGTVGRYELEFPVKADYPSVRNFINRTLSAVPAVGLDKLRIERKAVGDPIVSADIRFVVFVRTEP